MTLDTTKPVQTRDGRAARIICVDRKGDYSIIALVESPDGENLISCSSEGNWHLGNNGCLDLINIDTTPPALKIAREAAALVWGPGCNANCYRDGSYDETNTIRAILKALDMKP